MSRLACAAAGAALLAAASTSALAAGASVTLNTQDGAGAHQTYYWDVSGTGAGPFLPEVYDANGGGGGGGGLVTIGDGTNSPVAVKPASTAPTTADKSLVVSIRPDSVNANGVALMANSSPVVIASDQSAVAVRGNASTDGSTTITTGGTAQNLFSGATPANGFEVCNPNAADDLWVSDSTTAAANNTGSFRVAANGGCYTTPLGRRPIGAVSIVAATTGDKITARSY